MPETPLSRRCLLALLAAGVGSCAQEVEGSPVGETATSPTAPEEHGPVVPPVAPQRRFVPDFGPFTGLTRLARVELGSFPSAVVKLKLGAAIGLDQLYMKRDDLGGHVYGGGKVRKLEWLLGAAVERGVGRVVTFGGVESNHALATALYAQHLGLRADLRLGPQPLTGSSDAKLRAMAAAGATLRLVSGVASAHASAKKAEGRDTLVIAPGGTSPLGSVGYIAAAFELRQQIQRGQLPAPDVIVVPVGTMGVAAGLAFGIRAAGLTARIVGVRASSKGSSNPRLLRRLCQRMEDWLARIVPNWSVSGRDAASSIELDATQLGRGYARKTPRGTDARLRLRDTDGITLEDTYTAKALAGIIERADALKGKSILFWNTANSLPLPTPVSETTVPEALAPFLNR